MLSKWTVPVAALVIAGSFSTLPIRAQKLDVDALIHRWDADGDDAISRDELRNAMGSRLDKLIDKLFQAVDKNNDGRLDRTELNNVTGDSLLWLLDTRSTVK